MNIDQEKAILEAALICLQDKTGIAAKADMVTVKGPSRPDAEVTLAQENIAYRFAVEIKKNLTRPVAAMIPNQLGRHNRDGILVAPYVNPQLADLLRDMNVNFMDTAGNAYINAPPMYIFIKGNAPTKKTAPIRPARKAFQKKGLQVIFTLLCNPGLEGKPYRVIAKTAGVALGTVVMVMNDLIKFNYLLDKGKKGRTLIRTDILTKQWVVAYPEKLRPSLVKGRYTAKDPLWWQNNDIDPAEGLLGSEAAAAKLTDYLKPETASIFAKEPIGRLLLKNRMTASPDGKVEILEKFWDFEYNWNHKSLSPPLLVYADLIATGDARAIETAEIIYDKYIA